MHSGSPTSREKLGLGFNEMLLFTHWEQQGKPVGILHWTRSWKKAESSSTFLCNRNCALMEFSLMKADLGFSFSISGFHVTAQLSDSPELKGQSCSHPLCSGTQHPEQPRFREPGWEKTSSVQIEKKNQKQLNYLPNSLQSSVQTKLRYSSSSRSQLHITTAWNCTLCPLGRFLLPFKGASSAERKQRFIATVQCSG